MGLIFFLVGAFIFLGFLLLGLLLPALLPLLFMAGGLAMLLVGRRDAATTLNAFVRGIAAEGKVVSVSVDHSQAINGAHPWKLTYHFAVGSRLHEGAAVSWDSIVTARAPGQPLWVLYLPNDPEQNTLYPPLK